MKKNFGRIICLLMIVALVAVLAPQVILQTEAEAVSLSTLLEGKTLSVLGDSISTYEGVSNGAAAETSNSTIAGNWKYYPALSVTDPSYTWWMQTVDTLGMDLLVNNAWSGSYLLKENGTAGAYVDRCVQLHDDTGDNAGQKPDIIAFYLGTNDVTHDTANVGTYDAINFDVLITSGEEGYVYATPTTSMEAYAICLHKIREAYPEAEVYCFTLLPARGTSAQPTGFNADVKKMAEHFGCYVVDLYNDSGIISEPAAFNIMMDGNALHPGVKGMDAMTNAFVSAILQNSKYIPEGTAVYNVSYNLDNVISQNGTPKAALGGAAFQVDLTSYFSYRTLNTVTVTMGGEDVTASCYADGVVSIPAVTGDVTITADTVATVMDHPHDCEHCADAQWVSWDGNIADLNVGGHFCLIQDITLTENVKLHAGQDVTICLNGHSITGEVDRLFWLTEGSQLTITDCTAKTDANGNYTAGTIYAKSAADASVKGMAVGVYSGAKGFNLYDGIIDGRGGSNAAGSYGGLIDMYSASTINIYGGEIKNYTAKLGGAIYANQGTVNIQNAVISGCTAENGGAIYTENAALNISNATITGCNGTVWGGAAFVRATKVTLNNVKITDNIGTRANAMYMDGASELSITDATITDNSGTYWGSVYVAGKSIPVTLSGNVQIHSNTCNDRNSYGIVLRGDATAVNSYSGPAVVTVKDLDAASRIILWAEKVYVSASETVERDYAAYPAVVVSSGDLDPACITYTSTGYAAGSGAAVYLKEDNTTALCASHSFENGVCSVCGASHVHTCEACQSAQWTPFTGTASESGHYYLTGNTTMSSWVDLRNGQDVTICLNGYTLTGPSNARLFRLEGASKVTIVDCGASGRIVTKTVTDGMLAGIYGAGCEFNLYGGTVQGVADSGKSLIYMNTASTVNLLGGKLQNHGATNGGVIYATNGIVNLGGVTIENCTVTANGGAVYAKNITVNIDGAKFKNCTATGFGAAIYEETSTVTVENALFSGCSANRGGAVAAVKGVVDITGSTAVNCTGTTYGGMIYASGTDVDISDTNISGCVSQNGGAVFGNSYTESDSSLTPANITIDTGSAITGCKATAESGNSNGGAIQTYTAIVEVIDSSITGCSAATNGGAIYANKGMVSLSDTTISGCSANRGAAIFVQSGTTLDIADSTITGNTDKHYGAVTVWNVEDTITVSGNTAINGNKATASGRDAFATGVLLLQDAAVLNIEDLDADARIDVCSWGLDSENNDVPRTTGIIKVLSGTLDTASITYKNAGKNLCWNAAASVDGYHEYTLEAVTDPSCTEAGCTTHSCAVCGDSYTADEVDALGHSYENGTCTVCGEADPDYVEIEKFDLSGSTMTLGNTLEINFAIDMNNIDGEGYYAVITKQYADDRGLVSKTVNQADWEDLSGTLKFVSYAVSAKEMNDALTVTVYNADGVQVSNTYTDSVAGYCVRMLGKEEQKASPNAEKMTLYVDMVNYGAAAQTEWSYNVDSLANAGLTETQKGYATVVGEITNILVKGAGYAGTTLSLKENILLNIVYQNATIDQAAYAVVSFTDHYGNADTTTIQASQFQPLNSSMKYVQITNLAVADGRQPVTVELYDADGNVISTTVESIESYIARNDKALHDAIMAFCVGAYNSFH